MSDKKSTPALYELYYAQKPKRRGLFGGRKKNSTFQLSSDVPPANPPLSKSLPVKSLADSLPCQSDEIDIDDSPACFAWSDGRVVVNLPLWLFLMFVVAMAMSFLASYKLGYASYGRSLAQNLQPATGQEQTGSDSMSAVNESTKTTPALSPEMNAALNAQANFDLINGAVRSNNDGSAGGETSDNLPGNTLPLSQRPARCLIVMGYSSREELEIVKDFFADNGLVLDIAKQSRSYVLVTRKGFNSTREPEYDQLKESIYNIGQKYIVNRPVGGLTITLNTFRQAYPIDTDKLDFELD